MQLCIDIAILAATPPEVAGLSAQLGSCIDSTIGGQHYSTGILHGLTILVGTLGFGKVNAAATVAALAERFRLRQIWHVGCAGAYSEGCLNIGDVLITTEFHCGDEGILKSDEESPQSSIGIPLVTAAGSACFDVVPANSPLLEWARTTMPAAIYRSPPELKEGRFTDLLQAELIEPPDEADDALPSRDLFRLVYGPSLTVSLVSGDAAVAHRRFLRHQTLAENMEGSAVAQTCLRFALPVLECRGISNMAGNRDKSSWRLDLAIANNHAVVRRLLSSYLDSPPPWPKRHHAEESMD